MAIEEVLHRGGTQFNHEHIQKLLDAYKEVTQFRNPTPVVVGLIPIKTRAGRIGLLLVRRNIEPGKGQLALPGGYLEIEEWRAGLSREIRKELNVNIQPDEFVIRNVVSGRNNEVLLIIAQAECLVLASELEPFCPNHEVSERVIIQASTKLAFPSHTQAATEWFIDAASLDRDVVGNFCACGEITGR